MMKRFTALLLTMVMLICLPACRKTEDPGTKPGDTSVSSMSGENDDILRLSLDEQSGKDQVKAVWADPGGFYRTALFSRLLKVDKENQPNVPDLAEKYEVSDDGLTYTFTIREGATWHDGEPVTAEDVAWSVKMALQSAQINSVISAAMQSIEGADAYVAKEADSVSGVTAEGNVVTFKLKQPNGDFLLAMSLWAPYPKHLLENEDPLTLHNCSFWQAPVGSGPYKFKEFQPGAYLILEAYEGYYGEQPGIKTVQLSVTSDSQMATKAQAGELDLCEFSDLATVEQVMNANAALKKYEIEDAMYIRMLSFNMNGNKKMEDIRVRKAIAQAIDKKSICEQLFGGQAIMMDTLVPTSRIEYNPDAQTLSYDPEAAAELLKQAEYDFSQPLRIGYFYEDQQTIDLMDTLKYYLEQVGFSVELKFLKGDLLDLIYETRDYDLIYRGLSSTGVGEVYTWQKAGSIHEKIYGSSMQDGWADMIEQYVQSDSEKRIEIVKALQAHEIEACQDVPLWNLKTYVLVNEDRVNVPGEFQYGIFNYERHLENWSVK